MNTDKRVLTDEQRQRKNELARIRRMNAKNIEGKRNAVMDTEIPESDSVPDATPKTPDPEPMPSTEDLERKRKEAIAEKRRQSLILARSKITPKNQIRKEKDMEIDNAKKEAEEIKRKAHEESEIVKKKAEEDVELMKSLVKDKVITTKPAPKPRNRPVNPPKERQVPQQQSTEHLVNQSYAEQLQMRLREQMLHRMMSETFM
jgi:hypothetical protein